MERADVVLHGRELPPSARGRARARVEQRDQAGRVLGSRDLEAANCSELAQSAGFVIVLIVDPDALFRDPPPERASEPAEDVRPREPPLVTPRVIRRHGPRAAAPRSKPLPLLHGGVGLSYGRGLLPGDDLAGIVTPGLSPWSLPVHFGWRGSYRSSLGTPRRQRFSALLQEWRACCGLGSEATVLGGAACVGGAWGTIFPSTGGLTEGDRTPKAVYGPLVAVGPMLRAGGFAVLSDVALFFPRPRWEFSYADGSGRLHSLHELDRVVVAVSISLARTFR